MHRVSNKLCRGSASGIASPGRANINRRLVKAHCPTAGETLPAASFAGSFPVSAFNPSPCPASSVRSWLPVDGNRASPAESRKRRRGPRLLWGAFYRTRKQKTLLGRTKYLGFGYIVSGFQPSYDPREHSEVAKTAGKTPHYNHVSDGMYSYC